MSEGHADRKDLGGPVGSTASSVSTASSARTGLERVLGLVTEVRAGEGRTALLLTLNVFLLLTAYYVIKPVREGLILAMPNGAESKAYVSGAIAIALLFVVPLYGRVADRLPKNQLVVFVTLFFASHLLLFFGLSHTRFESDLGLVFFTWVGVFNTMLVAQFWAFANDVYTEEEGKRLFPLVGFGASAGGVAGASITRGLVKTLGTYPLMLVSAALLCLSAWLTFVTARRERVAMANDEARDAVAPAQDTSGTFALVFRHRYLLLIALFSILFSAVNTNGEYILSTVVSGASKVAAAQAASGAEAHALAQNLTTAFYGEFFLWVNVLVVLLQTFVVSRVVRFGGMRVAFFVMPVVALLDAVGIALAPVLAFVRIGKTVENAVDYSVNNTVRNMLWLPTNTSMKYKAKQATDTFFVRSGDVTAALMVALFARRFGWPARSFAVINVVLVACWLLVAVFIVREFERLSHPDEPRSS